MDVRCEKCGSEYELDDSQLKPGGLLVKCIDCGHIFAIPGRTKTTLGVASPALAPPRTRAGESNDTLPEPIRPPSADDLHSADWAAAPPLHSDAGAQRPSRPKERNWLIRLPNGEIEVCRELATLQQWIVSGKVTRHSGISRTGKTWKSLGEIRALSSFFDIADDAQERRSSEMKAAVTPPPVAQPEPSSEPGAESDPDSDPASTLRGVPAHPEAESMVPPAAGPAGGGQAPEPDVDFVANPLDGPADTATWIPEAAAESAPEAADDAGPAPMAADDAGFAPMAADDAEPAPEAADDADSDPVEVTIPEFAGVAPQSPVPPEGPVETEPPDAPAAAASADARQPSRGVVQTVPTRDVAFAGSHIRPITPVTEEFGPAGRPPGAADNRPERAPARAVDDRDPEYVPVDAGLGSRIGRWVVIASLLLMSGAAGVVYSLVFRPSEDAVGFQIASDAAIADDVSLSDDSEARSRWNEALTKAIAATAADTRVGLVAVEDALDRAIAESAPDDTEQAAASASEDTHRVLLIARGRVHTALAQHLADEAAVHEAAQNNQAARQSRRQAQDIVQKARVLAQEASRSDRTDPDALVLMADVSRLQGKSAPEIVPRLSQANMRAPGHREARLVRALLRVREKQLDEARKLLNDLVRDGKDDDVRPVYRLALLDFAAGRYAPARRHAEAVIAAQPQHEGAAALVERIVQVLAVDTSDPMPPEEPARAAPAQAAKPTPAQAARPTPTRAAKPTPAQAAKPRPAATPTPDSPPDAEASGQDSEQASGQAAAKDGQAAAKDAPPPKDTYKSLVEQAEKAAQSGDCTAALSFYEKALDIDPSGVAALTGMGTCHVQRSEFFSAHAKFRAALGVSPGYQDAMWGMAEGYRRQGNTEQAVDWYRRYLDEHPNGRRARQARRFIDRAGQQRQQPGQVAPESSAPSDPPERDAPSPSPPSGADKAPASPEDTDDRANSPNSEPANPPPRTPDNAPAETPTPAEPDSSGREADPSQPSDNSQDAKSLN